MAQVAEDGDGDNPPGVGGGVGRGHEEVPCASEEGVDHAVADLEGGETP